MNEHAEYTARGRPLAAERWVEGVLAAVERLKEFPVSGREVGEVRRDDIRKVSYGRYRIIHPVEAERVIVLTIRN